MTILSSLIQKWGSSIILLSREICCIIETHFLVGKIVERCHLRQQEKKKWELAAAGFSWVSEWVSEWVCVCVCWLQFVYMKTAILVNWNEVENNARRPGPGPGPGPRLADCIWQLRAEKGRGEKKNKAEFGLAWLESVSRVESSY